MRNTYAVYKIIKTTEGSDIDGKYFVAGNMDYYKAEELAKNLACIDKQTLYELLMCEMKVCYKVYSEQTGRIKRVFNA